LTACPSLQSEAEGQSEAIATNLLVMAGLKVPLIAVVIGEGGSGGALALGARRSSPKSPSAGLIPSHSPYNRHTIIKSRVSYVAEVRTAHSDGRPHRHALELVLRRDLA
jgi:hypothetical protein